MIRTSACAVKRRAEHGRPADRSRARWRAEGNTIPEIATSCPGGFRAVVRALQICQIDHEADDRHRLVVEPVGMPRPRTSINPASSGAGRASRRPLGGRELQSIIPDQAGEAQEPAFRRLDEPQGQSGFAGPRRSANENRRAPRPAPRRHARSRVWAVINHIAGRRTMKRAPSTWGAPPSPPAG